MWPITSKDAPTFDELVLNRSDVVTSCQRALDLGSDHADAILERAITAVRQSLSPSYHRAVAQLRSKSVHGACTDAGDAAKRKHEGVIAYRKDAFGTAAASFTQSLALVDERQRACKQEAGQAYSNRALCHLQLGNAEAALQDCVLTLVLTPSCKKAHFRKALALEQIGRHAEALDAASSAHALCTTDHAGAHAAATLLQRLRKALDAKTVVQQELPWPSQPALPCLQIGFSTTEGRALQVMSQVQKGALLLQEDPLAVVCCKHQRTKVCHFCMKALSPTTAIPCQSCPLAWYCCAEHRALDWQHIPGGAYCGVPWTILLPEHAVLAAQITAWAQRAAAQRFGPLDLNTHAHAITAQRIMEEALLSCLAADCTQLQASLVLRSLRQVCVNAIAVVPRAHSRPEDKVGLGLYPHAAMLNHSCAPSVSAHFSSRTLHVRALTALAPGTALRLCYGPQLGETVREVRRQQLWETYLFQCGCSACCAPDSDWRDAELVGLICRTCSGPITPSEGCAGGLCSLTKLPQGLPRAGVCLRCGGKCGVQEQAERLARLAGAEAQFQRGVAIMGASGDARAAVALLDQCLDTQQQELVPTNQVLGRTADALARAHLAAGDLRAAEAHAERALDTVLHAYGEGAIATAHQQQQLGSIRAALGRPGAQHLLDEAGATMHVHYGSPVATGVLAACS